MKTRALDRAERKFQIMGVFIIDMMNGREGDLTSYQIARRLGLTPQQGIRNMLNEMVASGELVMQKVKKSGRWDTVIYSLPEGVEPKRKKSRSINLNVRGKQQGQLELFS